MQVICHSLFFFPEILAQKVTGSVIAFHSDLLQSQPLGDTRVRESQKSDRLILQGPQLWWTDQHHNFPGARLMKQSKHKQIFVLFSPVPMDRRIEKDERNRPLVTHTPAMLPQRNS